MTLRWWILAWQLVRSAAAQLNDDDLMSFITRPEIRAPKFDVQYHDRDLVAPGYWFVAPYAVLEPEPPTKKWMPCQVGPHIYDGNGTLIWSGSCLFENRNTFDFKAVPHIDDRPHLSFIVQHAYHNEGDRKGGGVVLDARYEFENVVPVTNDLDAFNMHEFNVLPGGQTALATTYRSVQTDFADLGRPGQQGWVVAGGFEEIDVATGNVVFDWRTLDHIPLSESTFMVPDAPPGDPPGWDYIHVNSIDKHANGDYLLSARFSDTIYLISGADGHIIWRLGGVRSDFELDGFRFYRQHHARFVAHNGTHTTISFLNNASDEQSQLDGEPCSSILIVQADTTTKRATLVARYPRPDGGFTRLAQILPNGNIFAGWSEQGYHSEFTPDGTCLVEARFTSPRFSTYRAYKFELHGAKPAEPPAVKAFVFGATDATLSTVIYVSWNGATDVAAWNFYARADPTARPVLLGSAPKQGFETMFVADGYLGWVSAEAVDAAGRPLGVSDVHETEAPPDWLAAGFRPESSSSSSSDKNEKKFPEPADPAAVVGTNNQAEEAAKQSAKAYEVLSGIGAMLVSTLVVCSVGGIAAGTAWVIIRRRGRGRGHYLEVPSAAEEAPVESTVT